MRKNEWFGLKWILEMGLLIFGIFKNSIFKFRLIDKISCQHSKATNVGKILKLMVYIQKIYAQKFYCTK